MIFTKIDLDTWNRKNSYNQYMDTTPCTYSMTVNLNITHFLTEVKLQNIPFFPSILHAISTIVNRHPEFRMSIDAERDPGYYDICHPSYTLFHEDTETITNCWTEYNEAREVFLDSYKKDMQIYQFDSQTSKPLQINNIFTVSCIPWTTFSGFNLNLQKGYDYFAPIFTIGKYFEDQEKVLLPVALQVHHAVCDGFHVARFFNELQMLLDR